MINHQKERKKEQLVLLTSDKSPSELENMGHLMKALLVN